MVEIIEHVEQLLIPLIMSNIVHMLVVKKDLFKGLNIPIWEKGFGKNKTWRGFVALIMLNAFFEFIFAGIFKIEMEYPAVLGAIFGLTYALSELPNSFLKRKLGIAPGGAHSKYKFLFYTIDKSDSAIGVTIVYVLIRSLSVKIGVILFLVNSLAHALVAFILVRLKIKSSF